MTARWSYFWSSFRLDLIKSLASSYTIWPEVVLLMIYDMRHAIFFHDTLKSVILSFCAIRCARQPLAGWRPRFTVSAKLNDGKLNDAINILFSIVIRIYSLRPNSQCWTSEGIGFGSQSRPMWGNRYECRAKCTFEVELTSSSMSNEQPQQQKTFVEC